jgi:hypothetical protein
MPLTVLPNLDDDEYEIEVFARLKEIDDVKVVVDFQYERGRIGWTFSVSVVSHSCAV